MRVAVKMKCLRFKVCRLRERHGYNMSDQFEKKLFQMAAEEQMIMPVNLDNRIDSIIKRRSEQHRHFKMNMKKSLLLVAALVLLFSITATAAVGAWKERMAALNREELEKYFSQIYASRIPHDNYNRPLTTTEKERIEALEEAYEKEGLFPEGELTMLSEVKDYKGKGVGFYKDTSTFFFPDREMSNEELLQLIDFRKKRDYSLEKMNEMINAGEIDFPEEVLKQEDEIEETDETVLNSQAVYDPAAELTFFYTGDLELQNMAAGQNCIFLTGWNAVHKMEIGSSDSVPFYNDFEKRTRITALCQDKSMKVYLGIGEENGENSWKASVLVLDGEGNYLCRIDLSPYCNSSSIIRKIVVDDEGRLYIRADGLKEKCLLLVLDGEGNLISQIRSDEYAVHSAGGLCIGKDGKIYTVVFDQDWKMGIAAVDVENQSFSDVYMGIVPEDTVVLDIIAPGADTDFVFWGFDGIFTYNLGEDSAVNILPAYEAPCDYEGVKSCALPDGRIVFADCMEYRVEENEDGIKAIFAIPEKICFYYRSGLRSR